MSVIETIPGELLDKDRLQDFISFLLLFPAPQGFKKNMLTDWTKWTGVKLTKELVESAGIHDTR